jgi:hypothetical protein
MQKSVPKATAFGSVEENDTVVKTSTAPFNLNAEAEGCLRYVSAERIRTGLPVEIFWSWI